MGEQDFLPDKIVAQPAGRDKSSGVIDSALQIR
jgi:hypothetical protein